MAIRFFLPEKLPLKNICDVALESCQSRQELMKTITFELGNWRTMVILKFRTAATALSSFCGLVVLYINRLCFFLLAI